jgi:hypothetical protein
METKEYFDLDPIMYYINTCTALTDTPTGFVCTAPLATFTCTCICTMMNVNKTVQTELACDKILVFCNEAKKSASTRMKGTENVSNYYYMM